MIAGGSGMYVLFCSPPVSRSHTRSTPMYQILEHALKDPSNKTRFTLIFANVTEKDILLKEEFDTLAKKHPNTLNVVYTVDKAEPGWKGPTGYVNQELCKQYLPRADLGEKAKIFVCGPLGRLQPSRGRRRA